MKKLITQILSIWLVLLVIASVTPSYSLDADSGHTIYTRFTNINLPPSKFFLGDYPNHTFFEFWSSLEVINPSGMDLYVRTPSTCLSFITGNMTLENEHYNGFIRGGPDMCGCAFTNHTIEPGISEGHGFFEIAVNDTVDTLPNGNYTIWMFFDDYLNEHTYVHHTSEIAVNGSEIKITHTGVNETFTFPELTTPTPSLTTTLLSYSFQITLFVGAIVIILLRKLRDF